MKLNLSDTFFKIGKELSPKTHEPAHFSISYEEEFLASPNNNKKDMWDLEL